MKLHINLLLAILIFCCLSNPSHAQLKNNPSIGDSVTVTIPIQPVYRENYWITAAVIAVGLGTDAPAISRIKRKSVITDQELQDLDRTDMNSIDKWSLHQNASQAKMYATASDYTMTALLVFLPATIIADKKVRKDWVKILAMYYESQVLTFTVYNYSFLGPTFINRYRPVSYYENLPIGDRNTGYDRSSFYSGHVASTAAASFFLAKVFCDYHPDMGLGNKILMYGAASIPPLAIGYMRVAALDHFPSDCMVGFGVGVICGVLIPELHHSKNKNVAFGVFSSSQGTGLTMNWHPTFQK